MSETTDLLTAACESVLVTARSTKTAAELAGAQWAIQTLLKRTPELRAALREAAPVPRA